MAKVEVLGVQIDAVTVESAIDRIAQLARQNRASYVTKPYVEFMEAAYHQPVIRQLLNNSALCLPDGVALQWAAYYGSFRRRGWWRVIQTGAQIVFLPAKLGGTLPERFAGVDTTWRLLERCRDEQLSVFLIGSPKSTDIGHTAQAIKERLPEIKICGTAPGEIDGLNGTRLYQALLTGKADITRLAAAITDSGADVVLTGIGFPQQDALNAKLAVQLRHGVLIGEGGSFDYESFGGHRKRAPKWFRRSGLEWLWRLILEPSRWRRQLAIPKFIWHVYREGRR